MIKPKVGGRAKYTGQAGCRIEYGTIIEVRPDGKRFTVEWDTPDPDSGENTFEHDWHPASGVRPV